MHRFFPAQNMLLIDVIFQGNSVDIFHDNRLNPVGKDNIVHLYNIGMIQKRDCSGFIAKTTHKFVVVHIFFPEDFDRYNAFFQNIIRLVDVCHTSDTNQFPDLVTSVQSFSNVFIHLNASCKSGVISGTA